MPALTAEMVYGFSNTLLVGQYDEPQPTPKFHEDLWELFCRNHRRIAAAAPRGHAKSTAITHAFTLACICFRVRDYVLLVSDTIGQAIEFLGDIKRELTENEQLIDLFGVDRLIRDTQDDCIIRFRDGKEARIQARGSEQKLRGLKWRGKRPNLIIGDDLENDEIVENAERREKFRKWFFNALLPCGSTNCWVRIVGTILHFDSLLMRLMPRLTDEDTANEPLCMYSKREDRPWMSKLWRAHPAVGDYSAILWPEHRPEEWLRNEYESYVEQGMPDGYAQEYLNNPLAEGSTFFQDSDFKDIQLWTPRPTMTYIACDLAISERKRAAYTCFAAADIDPDRNMIMREVNRFRSNDTLHILDELFAFYERHPCELLFIEEENIARSLHSIIYEEMHRRDVDLPLMMVKTDTTDKLKRARPYQTIARAGRLYVDTKASWYPPYKLEHLQFPKGATLDQVDATAWIPYALKHIVDTPDEYDLAEEEYEAEIEQAQLWDTGRSSITGY